MELENPVEQINPAVAALLVIDMQNDYCHPEGLLGRRGRQLGMIAEMAPRLETFIRACRNVRLPVIFVRTIHYPWTDSRSRLGRLTRNGGERLCRPDTWGADYFGNLRPEGDETVITKHRYSAFLGTNLNLILHSTGIRSLLISGVGTNVCVESTLREGYMLDYTIVVLEDCVAATHPELHRGTLKNVELHFGSVIQSSELVKHWGV